MSDVGSQKTGEPILDETNRKIAWFAECIRRGDDPEAVLRTALREILKDVVASEHRERIRRVNAETLLEESTA